MERIWFVGALIFITTAVFYIILFLILGFLYEVNKTPYMENTFVRPSDRPPACDPIRATKPLVEFSLNSV